MDPHPKEHASSDAGQQLTGPSTASVFRQRCRVWNAISGHIVPERLMNITLDTPLLLNKTLLHIHLQHRPPATTTTS
jgi:hypothetical protein